MLVRFAAHELSRASGACALDIGCGAARNASALARLGWRVIGTDLSWPMVGAARDRVGAESGARFQAVLAPMESLPVATRRFDLIVAHGIWNLARSAAQFRLAVNEAARAAKPGAALFLFTFSRNTLPAHVKPLPGEPFVFNEFSGDPQCFLTIEQLDEELGRAGFARDPEVPLTEYNRQPPGGPRTIGGPVIYEALYRFRSR